jgi:hypothetical protein
LERPVNLLPDDSPEVAALREVLRDRLGMVNLEVGRFVAESSPAAAASALAGELGFRIPPGWSALSPEEGPAFLARLLARDGDSDTPAIPLAEAETLAARIRALFSDGAAFYPLGPLDLGLVPEGDAPPAGAPFDSGMLVVDGERVGLLWIED